MERTALGVRDLKEVRVVEMGLNLKGKMRVAKLGVEESLRDLVGMVNGE